METFFAEHMLDTSTETFLELAPGWVWLVIGFVLIATIWVQGNDVKNPDQDPVMRFLDGFVLTGISLLKITFGILEILTDLTAEVGGMIYAALARVGQYIEENVTIEIILDGTFWRLILVLALIAAGYTTVSSLEF